GAAAGRSILCKTREIRLPPHRGEKKRRGGSATPRRDARPHRHVAARRRVPAREQRRFGANGRVRPCEKTEHPTGTEIFKRQLDHTYTQRCMKLLSDILYKVRLEEVTGSTHIAIA